MSYTNKLLIEVTKKLIKLLKYTLNLFILIKLNKKGIFTLII